MPTIRNMITDHSKPETATNSSASVGGGYENPFKYNHVSSVNGSTNSSSGRISEIDEEEETIISGSRRDVEDDQLFEINLRMPTPMIREETDDQSSTSFLSIDVVNMNYRSELEDMMMNVIYVGVGKSGSSMDALSWTLRHAVTVTSSPPPMVCLVHVFPRVHFIPSPLGKLPRSQVNPKQLENFMYHERGKRRLLLQKFLDACSNAKVMADTVTIESDLVGKAILELIPILHIRKLVLGTTQSTRRKRKLKPTRRGSGTADQILQSAPEACEIKIVCQGKEVIDQRIYDSPSSSPSPSPKPNKHSPYRNHETPHHSFSCMCFKI